MAFFKDKFGAVLFFFCYFLIIFMSIGVIISFDNDKDSWIFYAKFLFLFYFIMSIWCHVVATRTDPGKITHKNNIHVLEIYINTHSHCVKNADNFNRKFRSALLKQMNENPNQGAESQSEDDYFDYGHQYEIHSSIRDHAIEEISKEYRMRFTRCRKCMVVRPPRAHHCTRCKACFLKKDHHCPWINNCLGQFNTKMFLLFCYYTFLGLWQSFFIFAYYFYYKNKSTFYSSYWYIVYGVFHLIFSIIFIIFTMCMINDQWNNIRNDTTIIDYKEKKFAEARNMDECWEEVFGEPFHIMWMFPVHRNKIRDIYINGKFPEPDPKELAEMEKKKEEEKKKKAESRSGFGLMDDMDLDNMSREEMLELLRKNYQKNKDEGDNPMGAF